MDSSPTSSKESEDKTSKPINRIRQASTIPSAIMKEYDFTALDDLNAILSISLSKESLLRKFNEEERQKASANLLFDSSIK
jgi:TnpA family transposase